MISWTVNIPANRAVSPFQRGADTTADEVSQDAPSWGFDMYVQLERRAFRAFLISSLLSNTIVLKLTGKTSYEVRALRNARMDFTAASCDSGVILELARGRPPRLEGLRLTLASIVLRQSVV